MASQITLAANAPNVYLAARLYAAQGLSVLPCKGKKPALTQWAHLQRRAATAPTIDLWDRTELLENVGIICGAVSGNLAVIDLDGLLAVEMFADRFPTLMDTYRVESGSGVGLHLYFYCGIVPPTTRITGTDYGNIELRANGCYVVAPPSMHSSAKPYRVEFDRVIAFVPDLNDVVNWIKRQIAHKHGGHMPPATNKRQILNASGYGVVALRNEAAEVTRAQPGERNNRLYRAALKMGSLIADGKIDRSSVEAALLEAASQLSQTDGEAATQRTITSGIETGLLSSRSAWKDKA